METKTRTMDEIYAEITALTAGDSGWRKDMTIAEKIAWCEAGVARLAREGELWRELGQAIPIDAPAWQFTATLGANEAAFEKGMRWQERLERYRAEALRDLPLKEEK